MRIIAGDFGGRRLQAPRGLATRPTSDRVRQAVFNMLGAPVPVEGARFRVLDLFAGSGALAFEALSRGADEAVLVDEDREAAAAIEKNAEALGVRGRVRVVRGEVGEALRKLEGEFDWIFLDPPYAYGPLDRALRLLASTSLADRALVIAEHDARTPPADEYDHKDRTGRLALVERRRWGDSAVSFYRSGASHE